MNYKRLFGISALLLLSMGIAQADIFQLTDNDYSDHDPQIDGGQVVWSGYDGHDHEIYLYDGSTTIQLTDNDYDDVSPQIDGGQVVWSGYDGYDYEIYLYDGSTTIKLTDNDYSEWSPMIDEGQVVWYGYDGNDYEIYLYDGSTTIQLTNNDYSDGDPQIDAGQVVWVGDFEIYLYDGRTRIQLTDNEYLEVFPQIDGGQVVWVEYDGYTYTIYLYDGSTTIQLTDNEYIGLERNPMIDAGQVIWSEYDGHDYEIYLYDGSTTIQLTDDDYSDYNPQIDAGQVVWVGGDYDGEIYLYDSSTTIQLTDNDYLDEAPQIDAGQVVWSEFDGYDSEIYLYDTSLDSIQLHTGWNLISVPLNLTTWQLGNESEVGNPLNITPVNCLSSIYRYNITSNLFEKADHFDDWGWYPATGSESFTALEPGRGYWVIAQQDCELTFTGTAPSDLDIPLDSGWNLIGWYSLNEAALGEEAAVGNPLNVTPQNSLTSIYQYNTTSGLFEKLDYFAGYGWWPATGSENFTGLKPGRGYWVMAGNDAIWHHPNS